MRRSVVAQKLEPALRRALQAPALELLDLDGERPAIDEEREPWIPVKYGPAAHDDWFGVVPATARLRRTAGAVPETLDLIVKVTPKVVEVMGKNLPRLIGFKENRRPRDITFGIGDILGVTVFEAASGGLFIPAEGGVRPGNFVTIPNQAVDIHGNISIPYAGSIRALGRTQVEVQNAIVAALKNRAIEPQVVVSLVEQKTSMITILGEGRSARVPATASPERLLDETALFLHRVVTKLPSDKQAMLEKLHGSSEALKRRKVLVVDDDARNIFALTSLLENQEMEVLSTTNGRSAIDIIKETPDLSLVLMDIMMPEMDGYETMREIRKVPEFRTLPILALTAKAMKGDR